MTKGMEQFNARTYYAIEKIFFKKDQNRSEKHESFPYHGTIFEARGRKSVWKEDFTCNTIVFYGRIIILFTHPDPAVDLPGKMNFF